MATQMAEVYVNEDSTHLESDKRIWVEVVAANSTGSHHLGDVLYATTWYATEIEALADASCWMNANNVHEVPS